MPTKCYTFLSGQNMSFFEKSIRPAGSVRQQVGALFETAPADPVLHDFCQNFDQLQMVIKNKP